jgi:lysyl-tRNA synthetase, class I
MGRQIKGDWVAGIADAVERQVQRTKGEDATIVCASGISPSGPVHLGNLREIMTVHLVVEELRARGRQVEYLHFWDDYDRLRKVPAGVAPDFARYIGCPLADISDPFGEFTSYAERYMHEFISGLERLGIFPHYIRQSDEYRAGRYTQHIKEALARRKEIFNMLAAHQTRQGQQETAEKRRAAYYPYRVYCEQCQQDATTITRYDVASATLAYTCQACGHAGEFCLGEKMSGKLVWKVDWPMRWAAWQVDFEPAGEDHAAPGSSFMVGHELVEKIYGWTRPEYVGYAFVGMGGRAKISSSAGTVATLASGLEICEPPVLRWLYTRRAYNQTFEIDYGQGLLRLYDEWDALTRQVQVGKASEANHRAYERALESTHGPLPQTPRPVPFSLLTSVLDVTQGNVEQVLRIASQYAGTTLTRADLEPRLTCALNWVDRYLPDDERTAIRTTFDEASYQALPDLDRAGIDLLVEQLDENWSLEALTTLIYNIPKIVRHLPLDARPDDELKRAQRAFFIAIYQLICGSDTGPRIPTLLLSSGEERVKMLLRKSNDG